MESLLSSAKSILILLPTNPHFDHVAAGLSLFLSLTKKKLNATIACPTPMLVEVNRLVGVDQISPELGNKNLAITFLEYPPDHIDKVSYDIENGLFKLSITPKPAMQAPKKEQVHLGYSGASADSVIFIGGGHDGHFPALSLPDLKTARFAHIGTKVVNPPAPLQALSFAKSASSACEVVTQLLKENNLPIEADIATNLLMGIEEGSRGFTSPETTAETFALVSELMRMGGKRFSKVAQPDRRNFPPGAIPNAPFHPAQPQPTQSTAGQKPPKSWYEPKVYKGSGTPVS